MSAIIAHDIGGPPDAPLARLYRGDCLKVMPVLDPVSHVISDPPYEDEIHKAVGSVNRVRNDGRTVADFGFDGINGTRAEVARAVTGISDGWSLLFCLAEGVRGWRDDLQAAGAKWDTTLAWVKPDAMPRFNGQGAARGFECCVSAWCGRGHRSWNGGGKRGVFVHNVNGARPGGHPTEKPVALMAELILLYTQPGDVVLDPFMGSGTTGVACLKTGRRFIGIERDDKWFSVASARLNKAVEDARSQPDFFAPMAAKAKQLTMEIGGAA